MTPGRRHITRRHTACIEDISRNMLLGSRGVLLSDKADTLRRRDHTVAGARHGTLNVRWATTGTEDGWRPSTFVSSKQRKRQREAGVEEDGSVAPMPLVDDHDDVLGGKELQVVALSSMGGNSMQMAPSLPSEAGRHSEPDRGMEELARALSHGAVETAGSRLLRQMGHRQGKGVGAGRVLKQANGASITLAAEDAVIEPVLLKLDSHGLGYDHHAGRYADVRMAGLAHSRAMGRLVTGDSITAAGRSDPFAMQGLTSGQRRMDEVLMQHPRSGLAGNSASMQLVALPAGSAGSRSLGEWAAGGVGSPEATGQGRGGRLALGAGRGGGSYGEEADDEDDSDAGGGTGVGRCFGPGGMVGEFEIEAGPAGESDKASLARLQRLGIDPGMLHDAAAAAQGIQHPAFGPTAPGRTNIQDAEAGPRRQRSEFSTNGRSVGVDGRPQLPGFVLGDTNGPPRLPTGALVCPEPPPGWSPNASRVAARVAAGEQDAAAAVRDDETRTMVEAAKEAAARSAAERPAKEGSNRWGDDASERAQQERAAELRATLGGLFDPGSVDAGDAAASEPAGKADGGGAHGLETAEARRMRLERAEPRTAEPPAGATETLAEMKPNLGRLDGAWPAVAMTETVVVPHATISQRLHLPAVPRTRQPVSSAAHTPGDAGAAAPAELEPVLSEAAAKPLLQETAPAPADVLAAVFGATDSESDTSDAGEDSDDEQNVQLPSVLPDSSPLIAPSLPDLSHRIPLGNPPLAASSTHQQKPALAPAARAPSASSGCVGPPKPHDVERSAIAKADNGSLAGLAALLRRSLAEDEKPVQEGARASGRRRTDRHSRRSRRHGAEGSRRHGTTPHRRHRRSHE